MLARLVRVALTEGPRVKGQRTYKVRIDNRSPLVLDGLALAPPAAKPGAKPSLLLGMSLSPMKSLAIPVSNEVVNRLELKRGARALSANLSGL
jgi:hypothetical protein